MASVMNFRPGESIVWLSQKKIRIYLNDCVPFNIYDDNIQCWHFERIKLDFQIFRPFLAILLSRNLVPWFQILFTNGGQTKRDHRTLKYSARRIRSIRWHDSLSYCSNAYQNRSYVWGFIGGGCAFQDFVLLFLVTIIRALQVAPGLQTVNVVYLFNLYQSIKWEKNKNDKHNT